MHVYRIAYRRFAKSPLDGEGSFQVGARWSSPGVRVAYTSTTLTLAMLEFLAHVELADFAEPGPPLVAVTATFDDQELLTLNERSARLPRDWKRTPAPGELRTVGDRWVEEAASLGLFVPSVILPESAVEQNVLVNPMHPSFSKVRWSTEPFEYDRRLLG